MPLDLSPASVRAADEHLALEEINGTEAMAFVASENEKSLAALTSDGRYETFRQQTFSILSATDRIAWPSFLGKDISNFWQDSTNPKGIWRRTTLTSYLSASPEWQTLIDIDQLSKDEGKDWDLKHIRRLKPNDDRCLISLSDGGKDAVVVREFDTTSKSFVAASRTPGEGGFVLPEGKHSLNWLDRNTLLVASDFSLHHGESSLTESGYPYIIKAFRRGEALADANEVFRGAATDVSVSPGVFRNSAGLVLAVIFERSLDTYRSETWLMDGINPIKLDLPEKIRVWGMLDQRLVFTLNQDWTREGVRRTAGSLLAINLNMLKPIGSANHIYIPTEKDVIFQPTVRQSVDGVTVLDDKIVATIYTNIIGQVVTFTDNNGTPPWTQTNLLVPDKAVVSVLASSPRTGQIFYSFHGLLTPSTLVFVDLNLNLDLDLSSAIVVHTAPAQFDASKSVVEQVEATSTDGTKIPYFLVRPRAMPMDGSTPTIVHGYGGFQKTLMPYYDPVMGKLWLENGGAFVVANIRGGGEFGPAWHQAALRENRQRAFDDFAAVVRDLEARRLTSSRRLGIYGSSNGGVLTSVSITQHPELFNAAVIESPLIDMLRYQDLPPGASWTGEYGDPRIPDDAAFIACYSAYQNLREQACYPRVYINTNTRDDRVHPGHARKFAARLGDMGYNRLYYEETSGGHSNGADLVANARHLARHYTYLAQQLID
jgi:prolyl oligopeptidase